uniref:Uncharacterized protein n=1 Tax=Arundo donax TaxID=35708 RepID=A0A0A8YQE1_ARUDO
MNYKQNICCILLHRAFMGRGSFICEFCLWPCKASHVCYDATTAPPSAAFRPHLRDQLHTRSGVPHWRRHTGPVS